MTRQDIDRLYAFNRWANARTLGAAEPLTGEQLNRDLKSSFPSVHATLVHMLSAEWIWLQRWNGASPSGWPDQSGMAAIAALRAEWRAVELGQDAFMAGVTDVALSGQLVYRNLKGEPFQEPLGLVMQHVVNHASYHRGQVTTMLRQLGAAVQGTDFITFVREHPGA